MSKSNQSHQDDVDDLVFSGIDLDTSYTINIGNLTYSGGGYTIATSTTPYLTTGIGGFNGTWSDINDGNTAKLSVKGDSEFEGNITVRGRNLLEAIDNIERRLGILTPNPKLEAEFEELKRLGELYREKEAELTEMMKTWEIMRKP